MTTVPTCTKTGVKTFTCETCGEVRTEELGATGHTVVVDDAVAPTCTEVGLTEGSHCSVCNEVIKAQEEVAALGHTWNDGEVTTAPTCTKTGAKTFTCAACGEIRTEDIKATGHTLVVDEAIAPTCTETGLTEGSHCSVCNEVIKSQEEVPALGHSWNDGEVTTAPTYNKSGIKTYICNVCKATREESVAMLKRIDISKADSKVKVSGIKDKIYNGKAQVQKSLMVVADGRTLRENTDYTVAYSDNKKMGTANLTITGRNGYIGVITKTFSIKTKVNKKYTVKKLTYKITDARTNGKGTVVLVGTTYKKESKAFTKLKIADTVTIGGAKFKVTGIKKDAFKGYKHLKTVVVGKNIKMIGSKTFYGCKGLKNIKFTSAKLTTIGKSAFGSIKKDAIFTLPKKAFKNRVNMIKNAGAPKKAVYKKSN